MMLKCYLFVFVSCIFLAGCNPSKLKIEKNIKQMQSMRVKIPIDNLDYWTSDSLEDPIIYERARLKLVVYVDSTECSMCYISKLFFWNEILKLEKKHKKNFSIFFIVEPSQKSRKNILESLKRDKLIHPIYIDTLGIFAHSNPNIPKEVMYHTFLVDENDSIIFVGNPLNNKKTKDVLMQRIDNTLRKPKGQ